MPIQTEQQRQNSFNGAGLNQSQQASVASGVGYATEIKTGANLFPISGQFQTPNANKTSATVQSNANIIENKIPNLKKKLKSYSNYGTVVGQDGVERYADGTIVVPEQQKADGSLTPQDTKDATDEVDSILNSIKASSDPILKASLDATHQQYDVKRQMQQEENVRSTKGLNRSLSLGGSRYAPANKGVMGEKEKADLMGIAALDAEEKSLIAQATAAQDTKDYQRLDRILGLVETKRNEKMAAAQKINDEIAAENKKSREQLKQSTRDNAVAGLLSQGVSDANQILNYLNYDDSGNQIGDFTAKEVADAIKNLTGETSTAKVSQDVNDFNYFKTNKLLPDSITSLPPAEQFLAWQKAQKEATTSDPSTRYQVITDPVTGNQSVFDRQSGSFVGGQPSGTEGLPPDKAIVLNAAKTLAVKDPSGGKLLVRTVNDKLAQGDTAGAMKFIKDAAYNGLDATTKKAYDEFDSSIALSQQALNLASNSDISAGPWKALYETKKPWLKINRDPLYAGLKQMIGQADAQIRRGFFGTAVTAAEGGTATAFLFDENDDMNLIKQKLKGNLAFFSYVNDAEIARTTGLPHPNLQEYYAKFGVDVNNLQGLDTDLTSETPKNSIKSSTNRGGI